MREIREVIKYTIDLAKRINFTKNCKDFDKSIIKYHDDDKIPYSGINAKGEIIRNNLDALKKAHYDESVIKEFENYLKIYQIGTASGLPGSHVNTENTDFNNSVIFMISQITTALVGLVEEEMSE